MKETEKESGYRTIDSLFQAPPTDEENKSQQEAKKESHLGSVSASYWTPSSSLVSLDRLKNSF